LRKINIVYYCKDSNIAIGINSGGMLTILIPIYNHKVVKLVKALMRQCKKTRLDCEILCFDDGSNKKTRYENSILSDFFGVNYTELSENLGRARIRNWMARSASGRYVLFLDCDSKIVRKDFIERYIQCIEKYDIVSGGRIYNKKPPRAKSKRLHWEYGRKSESMTASKRSKHPYMFFHSNNFLVRREIVEKYPFDENIVGYGYEDLLWASQLHKAGYEIMHIDNPVEHMGLEKADIFLRKAKKSIENLLALNQGGQNIETRLTRIYEFMRQYQLVGIFKRYYALKREKIEKGLLSENPGIFSLNMYKLNYYISLIERQ
jgi:glycosyltransferase involved in cell wall biosynthesis